MEYILAYALIIMVGVGCGFLGSRLTSILFPVKSDWV